MATAICPRAFSGSEWYLPRNRINGTKKIPPPIPKPEERVAMRKVKRKIINISRKNEDKNIMIQEYEAKSHVKNVLRKYYFGLETKRSNRGKLLIDEEMFYHALKEPTRGDVRIIVILENTYHVFLESKRHAKTFFAVMNDIEASHYPDRRPYDYYLISSEPSENYNLYIASFSDLNMIDNAREFVNMLQFYSIVLELFQPVIKMQEEKKEIPALTEEDQKWQRFLKMSPFDPQKRELEQHFFGFTVKYRKFKQKEEEKRMLIPPLKVKELIGMIARDIYPLNLRVIIRKDYKEEHQELINYIKQVLRNIEFQVDERRKLFQASKDYIEYLNAIKKEIQYQIQQLES